MARLLRYLATWSLSQIMIVSVLWIAVVFLAALQTPPARVVLALMELAKMMGPINTDVPMTALRILVVVTPIVAFVPPILIFLLWRRARRAGSVTRAA
jgi:hypothetical protein